MRGAERQSGGVAGTGRIPGAGRSGVADAAAELAR